MNPRKVAMLRWWRHAAVTCAIAACGSDDPTGPSFPQAAGSYQVTGDFDQLTPSQANVNGTITITQPNPDAGTLNVLGALTARVGTTIVTVSQFGSASVDATGRVVFQVAGLSATESWIFNGTLTADRTRVAGRHTLTSSSGSASGNFTATRQ